MGGLLVALVGACSLVWLGDLRLAVPQTIAIMLIWGGAVCLLPKPTALEGRWGRAGGLSNTCWVFCAALVVRGVLLLSPATLSDDIYRYLWEGWVVWQGGNPYLVPPGSQVWAGQLEPSWDAIRMLVNHPDVSAAYPPLTLVGFASVVGLGGGAFVVKLLMGAADAAIAWVVADILQGRRRPLTGAWLLAIHPLCVVESAGSGHFDSLALLLLVVGIRAWDRGDVGAGWVALGGMIKLLPFLILPATLSAGLKARPRMPGVWLGLAVGIVLGLSLLPFRGGGWASLEGLKTYGTVWAFNGSIYPLVAMGLGAWARPILILLGGGLVLWVWRHRRDPAEAAFLIGGAFVLLSPTVHPWYVMWAWVPAIIVGNRSWTLLATLIPLSYAALASYNPDTSLWSAPWWPPVVIYLSFFVALMLECRSHWTLPGPWATRRSEAASRSPFRI